MQNNQIFNELFGDVQTATVTRQYGNTLESARDKVIRALQGSKALFQNSNYTYIKHGKPQRPVPCYARQADGNYFIKVLFSRVTLDLPNGNNAIQCTREQVPEMHDKLITLVKKGVMDSVIKDAQERYRQAQMRQQGEE